jgi:hypothetical protein
MREMSLHGFSYELLKSFYYLNVGRTDDNKPSRRVFSATRLLRSDGAPVCSLGQTKYIAWSFTLAGHVG